MTRKEKKQIRLQILRLLDTHCAACRERNESTKSMCLTTCPIGKEMQQLSSMLERKSIVAIQEPKPKKKGKWTTEEEFYLWHHRNILTIDQLAEKLDRSRKAVYEKLRQLKDKHVS